MTRRVIAAALLLLAIGMSQTTVATASPRELAASGSPGSAAPVWAYYYIWFDPSSWDRAKTDYSLLGRYSSDDSTVMRQHVAMAKAAGVSGFLVSWKDTSTLTPRLERLVEIAREEGFSLGIVYQGLDFAREPISIEKVRHDLEMVADRYEHDPVFSHFGKPVVVWTGTSKFTRDQVRYAVEPVTGRLDVLASAGDPADYESIADLVHGNAHYWSSVNPEKPWYAARMQEMAEAVHAHHGLWVAPAAPGFDARLVGGASVVPRRGAQTLQQELAVAAGSDADLIGLISWNEFSENSHVEPSLTYGATALEAVADFVGSDPGTALSIDSSGTRTSYAGLDGWGAVAVTTVLLVGTVALVRRSRRRAAAGTTSPGRRSQPRGSAS